MLVGIEQGAGEALWALGQPISYRAGDQLFDRGGQARDLLIIESGSIELFFPVPILGAVKEIVVERLGPHDVVAWSAVVSPHALTLSARCAAPASVRAFPRDRLLEHLREHPLAGYVFMQNLAHVIGRRLHDFQNLWIREVRARIDGNRPDDLG